MDEIAVKAILLTQLALDHFGGDIDQAIAAVRANQAHLVAQVNAATKAAIAAEVALEDVVAEVAKP